MDAGSGDGTVVHTMQECTQLLPPHTRVLGVEVEKQRVINARHVACDEYGMEMQEATDMFIQADLRRAGDWVPPVPTVVLMNNVEWHHLDSHTRSGAGRVEGQRCL
jgi:type 1 glutamine amidotransferase